MVHIFWFIPWKSYKSNNNLNRKYGGDFTKYVEKLMRQHVGVKSAQECQLEETSFSLHLNPLSSFSQLNRDHSNPE